MLFATFAFEHNKLVINFLLVKVMKRTFNLIHCDIWGPYRTPVLCDAHQFLSIIDEASRTTWVYLMNDRIEANKILKGFTGMTKT